MNVISLRLWSAGRLATPQLSPICRRSLPTCPGAKFFTASASRAHSSSTQTAAASFLSRLLQFRQSQTAWSRWYRTKNDALASRARHAAPRRRTSLFNPPSSQPLGPLQRWFNRLPQQFIVWGILGLNGAVYMGWQYAADQVRAGDPTLYIKMRDNVLLSWRNIREGRIWTIITSTFSHSSASHILLNALTFYFMAPPVIGLLGNAAFMGLYMVGGISCSVVSLLLNKSMTKRDGASNGASGAIFAVMSFFACVSPQTKFLIFFVVPVPAWAVVAGIFVWDGISTITDRRTQVDGAGHVGGIIAGAAFYLLKRRFLF